MHCGALQPKNTIKCNSASQRTHTIIEEGNHPTRQPPISEVMQLSTWPPNSSTGNAAAIRSIEILSHGVLHASIAPLCWAFRKCCALFGIALQSASAPTKALEPAQSSVSRAASAHTCCPSLRAAAHPVPAAATCNRE